MAAPRSKPRLVAAVLSGVLCAAVDLVALFAVVSAFTMRPDGGWDEDVLTAIEVSALTGGVLAVLGVVPAGLAVALRWLRWWWLLPPAVLLLAAIARFSWSALTYPTG
ncbi:hypothetical protein [Saccharopolyspora cebuensis]|uniref:Uncharacterized protein n=1 Tax=Saccharopolyspora cebuensis TaxID=418759 RepID=A0ABV4CB60_9PSEU